VGASSIPFSPRNKIPLDFRGEPGLSRKTGNFGIDASGQQVLIMSNGPR